MVKRSRHYQYRNTVRRKRRNLHARRQTSLVDVQAAVIEREPDAAYPEAVSALADAVVLQMFELPLGETLRLAYTVVQQHQERHKRRAVIATATEALRDHLARLEQSVDDE